MEVIFLFLVIAIFVVISLREDKKYKASTYHQITGNTRSSIKYDKGKSGEYLIYKKLQHLENDGAKFLFNIYIPRARRETSEIDVLLICAKGIFVFESKNYSGWIFGNEAHKTWTQTFPAGRGRSHKESFYNPVMQNASHIKYLKRIVGETIPMQSIIVFSDSCTFKNVTVTSSDVRLTKHRYLLSIFSEIFSRTHQSVLSQPEISILYTVLYPYSQASQQVKEQHIKNIRRKLPLNQ